MAGAGLGARTAAGGDLLMPSATSDEGATVSGAGPNECISPGRRKVFLEACGVAAFVAGRDCRGIVSPAGVAAVVVCGDPCSVGASCALA